VSESRALGTEGENATRGHLQRFDEIAKNIRLSVRPGDTRIERYIGLEHIDPESLKIRRWGLVNEGTTFTLRFQEGQLLFSKRRAYLRKVAVADFDGVCSGDILVIESRDGVCNRKLLPFIMQSKAFLNYAVHTSDGSLSPRTKWVDLAEFEFYLPPLNEQTRFAGILVSTEDLLEKTLQSIRKTKQLRKALMRRLLTKGIHHTKFKKVQISRKIYEEIPEAWECSKLGDISTLFVPMRDKPKTFEGDIPWIRIEDFDGKYLHDSKSNQYVNDKIVKDMRLRVYPVNSVLASCSASIGTFAITRKPLVTNQTFIGISPDNRKLFYEFLYYFLHTRIHILEGLGTGTTITYIGREKFENLLIFLPPLPEQNKIASILSGLDKNIERQNDFLERTKLLKNNFVEKLLTPPQEFSEGA